MMRWIALAMALCGPGAALAQEAGQKTAIVHCGRCHVVPGGNPYGSIGSTPSFAAMRGYPDWKARFEAFYAEPPHAAITQIEGVTPAFERPPPIAPVTMTEADLAAILAFVATIAPKDVGTMD